VLTLNQPARTDDGRVLVSSVMLSTPHGELAPETGAEAMALVRGGLELAR
jgi:hypothetical protein